MSAAKSRRIGYRNEAGESFNPVRPVVVYEALVPLTCGRCGAEIAIGDRFSRRKAKAFYKGVTERCGRCAGLTRA